MKTLDKHSCELRASRLEREAEDLREEADDLEEEAQALWAKARSEMVAEESDIATDIPLLTDVLEDPQAFAKMILHRIGSHPMLSPLRDILTRLDALWDKLRDRKTRDSIHDAIKPLEARLHDREISEYANLRITPR